jgi:hypothetical protein
LCYNPEESTDVFNLKRTIRMRLGHVLVLKMICRRKFQIKINYLTVTAVKLSAIAQAVTSKVNTLYYMYWKNLSLYLP